MPRETNACTIFSFTSEVRYWFLYDKTKTYTLDFVGDDDVWVFINRKLAVGFSRHSYSGHWHRRHRRDRQWRHHGRGPAKPPSVTGAPLPPFQTTPLSGCRPVRCTRSPVFQAERQTTGSSYKLTLSGFNASASVCGPICGDGVLSPGEQCDDGNNAGGYGQCGPGCVRGPYCGDGIVQWP